VFWARIGRGQTPVVVRLRIRVVDGVDGVLGMVDGVLGMIGRVLGMIGRVLDVLGARGPIAARFVGRALTARADGIGKLPAPAECDDRQKDDERRANPKNAAHGASL
jgi:hypothetical protein